MALAKIFFILLLAAGTLMLNSIGIYHQHAYYNTIFVPTVVIFYVGIPVYVKNILFSSSPAHRSYYRLYS